MLFHKECCGCCLDRTTVTLITAHLILTQGADMPFHITDWNVGTKTLTKSKDGLCMVVVMKRKITSEMMARQVPRLTSCGSGSIGEPV